MILRMMRQTKFLSVLLEYYKLEKDFEGSIELHLVQSKYAEEYLRKKGINSSEIKHLSDYLNQQYIDGYKSVSFENREDIILYNPKKGKESTESIIKAGEDLRFVALENMSNDEVVALMRRAKIYIDFGNHPGKDRMPREAALCGCIVLTGCHGSAKYYEDISIPDAFKLDENEVTGEEVVSVIRDCLENYEDIVRDFEYYRKKTLMEKEEFISDIDEIFFEEDGSKKINYSFFSFEKIYPLLGSLYPMRHFKNVLFPFPLSPETMITPLSGISNFLFSNTVFSS